MNKVTRFTALLMATAALAACGSQADNQVAGNDAPSRKEKAEEVWSSMYTSNRSP